MKTRKLLLFLALTSICINLSNAQSFIHKKNGIPLSFKEMQRQFADWAKTRDLKKTKHWKYYKRWENEMQMHTDAQGEPADAAIYINECIKAADQKQDSKNANFLSSTWSPAGPFAVPNNLTGYMENGLGRINCIAFHPTDSNTYFVGVAQGGVWKTTNNGTSWTPLTDNLPILRISDICIDPNNPNTMYISVCDFEYIDISLQIDGRKRNTHYGLGVYKTTDGGASWQPTGLSFQLTNGDASLIRKIIINPANSNQLVACGVSGMYTSSNGGTTWNHTLDSLFWDLVQDPTVPSTLYAASGWLTASNIGYSAIYKSINFGTTWTMLNSGVPATGYVQRIKLAIAPSDHTCIYAMCIDTTGGSYGIYMSTDSGISWQYNNPGVNIMESGIGSNAGGQGNYDLGFAVNPINKNIIYVGGVNLWSSIDGGQTFNPASYWTLQYGPSSHGDFHFIETQPATGTIFACNDGGLYRTRNIISQTWTQADSNPWPTEWTNISNGLAITSFYRISSSRNTIGRLVAGAQDNATFYFDGTTWSTIFGGDGMDNYLDPLDDYYIIGSSQYGYFYNSSDAGASWNSVNVNSSNERSEWTSPLIADYNNWGTLYAGCTQVKRSDDNGYSWYSLPSLPSNGINDNEISAIALAHSNSDIIYVTRRVRYEYNSPATMFVSVNGGTNWNDITNGLPDSLYFTSTDVSQTNANTAYVAMAGFSDGFKVFKTTNLGLNWQNISYNLPNIPVNCIKTISGNGGVMIATDLGIYMLDSINNIWINQSAGLPNVIVSDIEFNQELNKIYISTFGRGIWETDLSGFVAAPSIFTIETGIELYPSPNRGSFTIKINSKGASSKTYNLEVIDITGKSVYKTILSGKSSYNMTIKLLPGMYYAKVNGQQQQGVKRFVVE